MQTISIERDALRAMLHLAAKGDVRFYLNSILVEANAERTRLVATTGHILGVYQHAAPKECPNAVDGFARVIVPREIVERVKSDRYALKLVTLTIADDGKTAELNDSGSRFPFAPIEGEYPNYAAVLPHGKMSGVAAQFDANLLVQFAKAHKTLGARHAGYVHLEHNGAERCGRVTFSKFPGFAGAIMPVRAPEANLTDWAAASLQPQGVEAAA